MPSIGISLQKIKMSFKALLENGANSKKNTNLSRKKIIKIAVALMLSNILYSMLFSQEKKNTTEKKIDGIEVIIEGKLFTSFEKNKEVLLTNPSTGQKFFARLLEAPQGDGSFLILTSEVSALKILARPLQWNILPYLKNFEIKTPNTKSTKEIDHEIHF